MQVRHSRTNFGFPFALATVLAMALVWGFAARSATAQNGERLRAMKAQRQAAVQQRKENRHAAGVPKAQPNTRGMEGLPPKWVDNVRDMSPEDQERFMQNNQRFQSLPPERQAQIRNNLQKWNSLSPD